MTLEAAYTKLLWAIARRDNRRQVGVQETIKQTFQQNVAGEMSASVYTASFGDSTSFVRAKSGEPFLVSDVTKFVTDLDRYDIAEVFVRIEGLRFSDVGATGLVRILY